MRLLILATAFLRCATAALVHYVIEDTDRSAVTYFGDGWEDQTCTSCGAMPNLSEVGNQTWHAATYFPTTPEPPYFTITFTGVSIYIYSVLWERADNLAYPVDVTFTLDGQRTGTYTYLPRPLDSYAYHHLVWSITGLPDAGHTLEVRLGPKSYFLFDYAVFSTEVPSSNTSQTISNWAPVIGGVVGGAGVILVLSAILLFLRHRKKREQQQVHSDRERGLDYVPPVMASMPNEPGRPSSASEQLYTPYSVPFTLSNSPPSSLSGRDAALSSVPESPDLDRTSRPSNSRAVADTASEKDSKPPSYHEAS